MCGTLLQLCQQTNTASPKISISKGIKMCCCLATSPKHCHCLAVCLLATRTLPFLFKTCLALLLHDCCNPKGLHVVIVHDNMFPCFKGRMMFRVPPNNSAMLGLVSDGTQYCNIITLSVFSRFLLFSSTNGRRCSR